MNTPIKQRKVQVQFYCDYDTARLLQELAVNTGKSQSQFFREGLELVLEKYKNQPKQT